MNRDFLKIGQEVIISFYEDNALRSYSGEIKEADRYLIGINFEADKRKPRCITPGMEVNIRVKDAGEDIYITARIVEDHWPDLIRMDLGDVGGDDRRSYVRVDCMLPMEYRRIDKDNSPWDMEGILESWSAYSFLAETDGSELELERSGDLDPRILQRLVFIEKKLDFVINYITQTKEQGFKLPRMRRVNISGSGLKFYAEEEFRHGDQLEIIIILPIFPPVSLLLKGEVIRTELRARDGGKIFEIALRFLDIDEKDRDKIIIYTIKKQMAILRSKNKT